MCSRFIDKIKRVILRYAIRRYATHIYILNNDINDLEKEMTNTLIKLQRLKVNLGAMEEIWLREFYLFYLLLCWIMK